MKYNLYINTNGKENKIEHDFDSLMDVDYTTSRILNKEDLLARVPEIIDKSNVYIKDTKGRTYAIIYNNDFLKTYIDEKKVSKVQADTKDKLHRFLKSIRDLSVGKDRGYLIEPYKQKGLNKFEMKSLELPKSVRNAIIKYSDRTIILNNNYGAELQREYDHDNVIGKFSKTIISNYDNLRSLIVWINNYKKIMDKKKNRELKKQQEERRKLQVTFDDVIRNKKETKKVEYNKSSRVMKNGQHIFDGIDVDINDLDDSFKGKTR